MIASTSSSGTRTWAWESRRLTEPMRALSPPIGPASSERRSSADTPCFLPRLMNSRAWAPSPPRRTGGGVTAVSRLVRDARASRLGLGLVRDLGASRRAPRPRPPRLRPPRLRPPPSSAARRGLGGRGGLGGGTGRLLLGPGLPELAGLGGRLGLLLALAHDRRARGRHARHRRPWPARARPSRPARRRRSGRPRRAPR